MPIVISVFLYNSEFHLSIMFKLMLKSIKFKNMNKIYQKYFYIVICTFISVSTRDTWMWFHTILIVSEAFLDWEVPNIFWQFYQRWFFLGVWALLFIWAMILNLGNEIDIGKSNYTAQERLTYFMEYMACKYKKSLQYLSGKVNI